MNTDARTLTSVSPSSAVAVPPAVLRIKRLGRPGALALRSEFRWEVRAVFRRSFYCRSRGGSFICVGSMSLGCGPLNVLCHIPEPIDWEVAGLTPGAVATCNGRLLCVAERYAFSLADAEVWRPAMLTTPWQPATITTGLVALAREACTRPARGGLQSLIPILAEHEAAFPRGACEVSPLIRLARVGIEPLADWLEGSLARPAEPIPVPTSAIDALIGLGPGLTPSGDDFLGGVLLALQWLGALGPGGRLAAEVLSRAERGTNEISRAHLAAAAGGEGLAPLHAILSVLCTPGAPGMDECLTAIDAIGHTSGWDALAGVCLAAAVMARVRSVRRATAIPA